MSECKDLEYIRYKLLLRELRRKEEQKDETTDSEETSGSQLQFGKVD